MINQDTTQLKINAIALLRDLISEPSISGQEDGTAGLLMTFMDRYGVKAFRQGNNVWAVNAFFDPAKPSILLNSHHDTVKPNTQYTRNPYSPEEEDGRIYGLGSNDAGGCLVALLATFIHYYTSQQMSYNLAIAATAEEEISGANGVAALLQDAGFLATLGGSSIGGAIVGEPTLMSMAVAERGLMVIDALSSGRAGHAARDEGENAIYKALADIAWIKDFRFPKVSELLGPVKMSVTAIQTENKAHNMVPATCGFTVDVRVNELYSFAEVLSVMQQHISCTLVPRSMRLQSSMIPLTHPLVHSGLQLGMAYYGSPTTSDKALMNFPALKLGPGDSARSHTADEFIYREEIERGIDVYIKLLENVLCKAQ